MAIKGIIRDVTSVTKVMLVREKKHNSASDKPDLNDHIGSVAKSLHPGKITIKLISIEKKRYYRIFTFTGCNIPYFKPGQYMTLEYLYNGYKITRPFNIYSSPKSAVGDVKTVSICITNKYSDTVKCLYDNAKIGDDFIAEIGLGFFTYDAIRDSNKIICIADDEKISPFHSMIEAQNDKVIDCDIKLIDKKDLENNISNEYSYFVYGSTGFVSRTVNKLKALGIDARRIRMEKFNSKVDKKVLENSTEYTIEVLRGIDSTFIKAKGNECIASALEKNGIEIHTCCRNGICGNCRIKVIEGEYYVPKDNENRRKMDIEYGYVYSCHTYPKSDMKIKINI